MLLLFIMLSQNRRPLYNAYVPSGRKRGYGHVLMRDYLLKLSAEGKMLVKELRVEIWHYGCQSSVAQWLGRRSLAVTLSLTCASIHGRQATTLWVNCPLWVSQLSQLSLPSLWGRKMTSNPCNYMAVWLQAKVRDRSLGCRLTLSVLYSAAAAAVCSLWRFAF